MTRAEKILREATARGCRLTPVGTRLGFHCPGGLPIELERTLIREKWDLLELLTELRNLAGQIFSEGDVEWGSATAQQVQKADDRLALNPLDPLCVSARKHLAVLTQTSPKERT